ncbi:hypothetical protein EVAR_5399_1 [Eumeta japonica]|uniref:Uncharacterized protein n=1 Tax=Eumeta variegata TaxID=151549 RepID=A0A4C2A782_EUMVA|nr:hypothetical protein EVAR_5399_1 [Eumeta japonica]
MQVVTSTWVSRVLKLPTNAFPATSSDAWHATSDTSKVIEASSTSSHRQSPIEHLIRNLVPFSILNPPGLELQNRAEQKNRVCSQFAYDLEFAIVNSSQAKKVVKRRRPPLGHSGMFSTVKAPLCSRVFPASETMSHVKNEF